MSGPTRYPEHDPTEEGTAAGIRRWLRLAMIAIVIVLLLVLVMTLMGGGHRPPAGAH